ncbi:MAG: 4-hydroxythreonine-4-phosphate dehydrogenase PdxA, partial [Paludibacter sp.]|nr:4-hydroxythreonine-4-phosphate dehydrogenase PdxA [Paludibacter sp.]
HIPVSKVPQAITPELIKEKLLVFSNCLKNDFNIQRPRIAVLGLNPHAGDNGVIGNEENEIIKPALKLAEKEGVLSFGPYPADGFFGSGHFSKFDGILAMYHDQGLIPFKALSMESGVNYTAGLSIIRTSPAHGTAYDLAGKNMASEESFRQAVYMAYDVYHTRKQNVELAANPLKIEPRNERSNRIE